MVVDGGEAATGAGKGVGTEEVRLDTLHTVHVAGECL